MFISHYKMQHKENSHFCFKEFGARRIHVLIQNEVPLKWTLPLVLTLTKIGKNSKTFI